MIYRFIDDKGTLRIKDPGKYNFYFPLTDAAGQLLSATSPGLSGDIKQDNGHFLTPPASILDLKANPLCTREFFIKAGSRIIRLSRPLDGDILEAGLLYQKIFKKAAGLEIEVTQFVPCDTPVEVFTVRLKNSSDRNIPVLATSFVPLYGRAEKNLRDHRHVSALLNRLFIAKNSLVLKPTMIFDEKGHRRNETLYYAFGFEGSGRPPQGQYPTMDNFFGEGDIFSPDAVYKDVPAVRQHEARFDGKEACAAFRFSARTLRPQESVEYSLLLGIARNRKQMLSAFKRLGSSAKLRESLLKTRQYWQEQSQTIRFDFQDKDLNNWLRWVQLQPTLRRLFGCSFLPHFDYGKGGRGWRDLWQDALALLYTEPDRAKEIIARSFRGVRLDGSNATIITQDGGFLADRNRISRVWMDHGVWPFLTTRLYLHQSADKGLLLKETAYFRDHQLRRAKAVDQDFRQRDFIQRAADGKPLKGTILEHLLVQNLVQFFNVGEHNIVRLENADWNDGLDMAAERGESVAFSCMYAHNLRELAVLLDSLKGGSPTVSLLKELGLLLDTLKDPVDYSQSRQKQERLQEYFDRIQRPSGKKIQVRTEDLIRDLQAKALHMTDWINSREWLGAGFFNGYYDNKGLRVESAKHARMLLASQVFAIMSKVACSERVSRTWDSIKARLWDRKLGGIRLNTDFRDIAMDFGRAFGFSYGDKENGAFFSHMNVMLAYALCQAGFAQEGKQVLRSIYDMACSPKARIPAVLPEYFNAEGRGLYLYLTGSASWFIHTLIEQVIGLRFHNGDITLQPSAALELAGPASKISLQLKLAAKTVLVEYLKDRAETPLRNPRIFRAFLNGKQITVSQRTCIIPSARLSPGKNTIRVFLEG